jgi:nicotinate-nucleotide adenylyltransferase
MRIGIFGGTFDPPHLGHLILAERCREAAKLDEVWFLPSYSPPHKTERGVARFEHRCDMVTLAITGQPNFRVEPIEKELPPPSYTVQTLEELRTRYPIHDFTLIIGGDSLRDLPTWHKPKKLLKLAEIVAVARPGIHIPTTSELAASLRVTEEDLMLQIVACPLIDLSSRELRQRVKEKKTIRFAVPRSVEEYVRERKLYLGG